jgi:hypothetical protein
MLERNTSIVLVCIYCNYSVRLYSVFLLFLFCNDFRICVFSENCKEMKHPKIFSHMKCNKVFLLSAMSMCVTVFRCKGICDCVM